MHVPTGRFLVSCAMAGGLYEGTKAPQGKAGSATDVMALAKRRIVNEGEISYLK